MKIIKYGNDEGIVFDNGNSLWDTYSQSCCEYNYAEWDQLEPSALNYDFDEESFQLVPNDYGFRFGDKNRTFFIPCYKVYGISETFDYNPKTADGVKEQISRMQGEFIIKKPDLTGESKWEIINDKVIKVKINDENFKNKLKDRSIKLSYGDKIKGVLISKTYISKDLEVLENEYFLEDIKGIIEPSYTQEKSLFK
ncbi:hypothetical protein FXI80_08045 [Campylobacter coli]|nr:hypothetical protein [Campylobacter coli]ECC2727636.1 hypothetical protein [Campylobacter coli]ECL0276790.1 hypothetical protein [Campylobacter coli]ECO8107253.1 hypothetical protein [Campylobacter coli]ECY0751394.1 hypothetical protein [Campylobacter coli]